MPVQTTVSALAARLGNQVAEAYAKHKDAPVDTGFQRLPPDIKGGVAKITFMGLELTKDDKAGPGTKGLERFRVSAAVVYSGNPNSPNEHTWIEATGPYRGQPRTMRVINLTTSKFVPMFTIPAKGKPGEPGYREEVPFADNLFEFQNIFKMLRVPPCEGKTTLEILTYFENAWKALMADPKNKPVFIRFSTRQWTPPLTATEIRDKKKLEDKEVVVFEEWHERVDWTGTPQPPGGVTLAPSPGSNGSAAHDNGPPPVGADGMAILPPGQSLEERVAALLKAVETDESAGPPLLQLAWDRGWTEEETSSASWVEVGEMALSDPATEEENQESQDGKPTIGSKWNYTPRDSAGNKMKGPDKKELPSEEIELVTVDEANKTCTAKKVKDGRDVLNQRTRKPMNVKWEWLE